MLGNEEFRSIITALGTNIDESFSLASLKYHKVIILSDADQDGAHIRAILLTFFYRYMKELITEGHVYIGMPPLYKCKGATGCNTPTTTRSCAGSPAGRPRATRSSATRAWAR